MTNEDKSVAPEPKNASAPATVAAAAPAPPATAGPLPQSAFAYPAEPDAPRSRSRGTRLALLITGAVVVALLIFGGGFWTGSVVNSIPGISHSGFGDDPRMGPGGPGDPRQPGRGNDDSESDTDTEPTDPSTFEG